MNIDKAIKAALENVARHGDTDIFPFPFETLLFKDCPEESKKIIAEFHADFQTWLSAYPPQSIPSLTQVGYSGFRWATSIDPFWNVYYLALVLTLAEKIEKVRIPQSAQNVFSYRFEWKEEEAKIFKDSTWIDFRLRCLHLSNSHPVVVQTDISDFYPRIYHHRLENALHRLPDVGDTPKRILSLLGVFSKNVSYGLPVGGPASRILSELALNGVDTLLLRKGVQFCRYADDYAIFCNNKAEAYRILVFLAEKLFNEGLVLQKKKTRILTSDEFRQTAQLLDPADATNKLATEEQKLLSISLRYDPYSPNAVDEYEELRGAIHQIDIIGILGREIAKTNIDSIVAKQAVQAIVVLSPAQKIHAVEMLLDESNLMTLAPVFVTVMRVVKDVYADGTLEFQTKIDELMCDLFTNNFPFLSVEVNLAYYLKTLCGNQTQRKEEILGKLFEDAPNPMIRRLVILIMSKWNCTYWLSDIKNRYGVMTIYERRAFLIASYFLGDEGKHWREFTKSEWKKPDLLLRNWFAKRFQTNKSVPL